MEFSFIKFIFCKMIFSSITQIYSAYPFGWVLCHFQAVDMISSRLLSSGFHPNTSFALSLDTIKISGTPALRFSSTALIGRPVTFLSVSITYFTVNPTPFPRLKILLSPPLIRYFTAKNMCLR